MEVLEERTNKITTILEGVTNNIVEFRVVLESNKEDNQRVMETIRRETNMTLERLERKLTESRPRTPPPRDDAYVEGLKSSVIESLHATPRNEMRHGGLVETP